AAARRVPVVPVRGRGVAARAADHVRAPLPVRDAMTARRIDGWTGRVLLGPAVLLSGYPPVRLSAQDSQFGIRGLGTPGRFETVRARSTGGAFGPFDPMSPLAEASLADLPQLAATALGGTWSG